MSTSALIPSAPADTRTLILTSVNGWQWKGPAPLMVTSTERGLAFGRSFVTPEQAVAACPVARVAHPEVPAVGDLWILVEQLGPHISALLRDGDNSQDGGIYPDLQPIEDMCTRQIAAMMAVDGLSLRAPPPWAEGWRAGCADVTRRAYAAEREAALAHPLWPIVRARLEARIEARVARYAAIREALDTQGAAWIEALRSAA